MKRPTTEPLMSRAHAEALLAAARATRAHRTVCLAKSYLALLDGKDGIEPDVRLAPAGDFEDYGDTPPRCTGDAA